jgi:antitoxin VapB
MSMNIKNEETHRLAQELAALTGQSITAAITDSIRERLSRVRSSQQDKLSKRIMVIGKNCAAHLKKQFRDLDHGELLYDDKGLPR